MLCMVLLILCLISFQVFHYYGPALEFLQMVDLSELPPFFISDLEFELYPLRFQAANDNGL